MDNYYFYCIARNAPDGVYPDLAGYAEEAILGVRDGDLTAIVSKTAVTHIEMGYENLRCHENVIARIMETYDVLPMSFSTICASLTEVSAILRKYGVQFRENLDRVSGKVELGMKVFHKLEPEGGEPSGGPAASPRDYIMGKFEKYLDQKKQNEKLFAAIDEVHRELSGIADDGCYTKPMKNNLIFNASYLVQRSRKSDFDRAVANAVAAYPAYRIYYSGPWPAYHFTKIVREEDENG